MELKGKELSEVLNNRLNSEQKKLLQGFFENEKLANLVKTVLLRQCLQQGTVDQLVDDTGQNWIMNVDLNLSDEQYAKAVKEQVSNLVVLQAGWENLERLGKKKKSAKEIINHAK